MKQTTLGRHKLKVPMIGLGCMGMTEFVDNDIYGKVNEEEAIAIIHRSRELGCNFIDTSDLYGPWENERLVSKAIRGDRDKYIIATKFGYEIDDQGQLTWQINGKKDYVKKAVESSLKNLNTDYIDLYYLNRLDPKTPIEETIGAMVKLVREGKIGYIGLSEVSVEIIKRAQKIHPIAAVQSEYSLFERTVEQTGLLDTLKSLGIGFIAYSPHGRGLLSGNSMIENPEDIAEGDFQKTIPRFQGRRFYKNPDQVIEIKKMAKEKGITISQLAIAWTIAKGSLPIPGTKRVEYLEQNISAASVELSVLDMDRLESIVPLETSNITRYDSVNLQSIN